MPVGKWMDMKGIDVKPTGGRSVPVPPSGSARQLQLQQQHAHTRAATPPLPTPRPLKKEKEEKELGPPPAFEPWLDMNKGTFKPIQVLCNLVLALPCTSSLRFRLISMLELTVAYPRTMQTTTAWLTLFKMRNSQLHFNNEGI